MAGGRPKGKASRKTQRIIQELHDMNFNPLKELVETYREAREDKNLAVASKVASDLAGFCFPKLKAVEVSEGNGDRFKDPFEEAFKEIGEANSAKRRDGSHN